MSDEWLNGILRGRAQLRHMLAVQTMRDNPTEISDEVLKHFREERRLLNEVMATEKVLP